MTRAAVKGSAFQGEIITLAQSNISQGDITKARVWLEDRMVSLPWMTSYNLALFADKWGVPLYRFPLAAMTHYEK